jgi:hypothetical protein
MRCIVTCLALSMLFLAACGDRQPLIPTPADPEYFYGWSSGDAPDEFWVHFDPEWAAAPVKFWGAGVEFHGFWIALAEPWIDPVFTRYYTPTSGKSALHLSLSGLPARGEIRFDFPVRDISFNIRLWGTLEISCSDDQGKVVVAQKFFTWQRIVNGQYAFMPYPVEEVKLEGRGIRKCALTANGGMLDDLRYRRYRRDRNDLELSCTGDRPEENRVTRGQVLTCTASASAADAEIVVETWSFTGMDSRGQPYRYPEEADGPVTGNPWRGKMAISGTISVRARINGGEPQEKSVQVSVDARAWEHEPVAAVVTRVGWEDFPVHRRPPAYPAQVKDLGRSVLGGRYLPFSQDVVEQISDYGPNHYLVYFRAIPIELEVKVLVHPELETQGDFWRRQLASQPAFERQPFCLRSQFGRYIELVLAHEGYPPNPESHSGVYIAEVSRVAGPRVEGLVYPDIALQTMADDATATLDEVLAQAATAADRPVDERYGIPFGCSFNFDRR